MEVRGRRSGGLTVRKVEVISLQKLEGSRSPESVHKGLLTICPRALGLAGAEANEVIRVEDVRLPPLQPHLVDKGALARAVIQKTPAKLLPVIRRARAVPAINTLLIWREGQLEIEACC